MPKKAKRGNPRPYYYVAVNNKGFEKGPVMHITANDFGHALQKIAAALPDDLRQLYVREGRLLK